MLSHPTGLKLFNIKVSNVCVLLVGAHQCRQLIAQLTSSIRPALEQDVKVRGLHLGVCLYFTKYRCLLNLIPYMMSMVLC